MNSDNPSLLIQNWKVLTMGAKQIFLEYLVAKLEEGTEKYTIAEYLEIFLLTVFLNTERETITKEKVAETYVEPALEEEGTKEIISDQRADYILKIIANAIVKRELLWQGTFKLGIKNPIKAENLFEYRFYSKCIEARRKLAVFIKTEGFC